MTILNAKWVCKFNPSNFIVNERNSQIWVEFCQGIKKFEYELVSHDDSGIILFDNKRNLYAKIGDLKAVFGIGSVENLNYERFFTLGHWVIKPTNNLKGNKKLLLVLMKLYQIKTITIIFKSRLC